MEDQDIQEQANVKPNETPEERFKRIAVLRVPNAIKKIKLIGNLSASAYKYTDEQIDKIISSLREAIGEVEAKFKKGSKKTDTFSI